MWKAVQLFYKRRWATFEAFFFNIYFLTSNFQKRIQNLLKELSWPDNNRSPTYWLFAFKQNGERNAFSMHKEGYPFWVAFSEGAKTIHHRPQPDLYPPGLRSAFSLLDSIPRWVLSLPPECRHIIICVEIKCPSERGLLQCNNKHALLTEISCIIFLTTLTHTSWKRTPFGKDFHGSTSRYESNVYLYLNCLLYTSPSPRDA